MAANNNLYDMWKDFYNQSSNLFDEKVQEDFPAQGVRTNAGDESSI